MKCCLSIDFEDFSHDLERELGVERPATRRAALVASYDRMMDVVTRLPGSDRLTFFCTGQVAIDHPGLGARIAGDGHEVGCHSLYHDPVSTTEPSEFARSLDVAITALTAAGGKPILGYRAPGFSILENDSWAYTELAKRFVYDSSYVTGLRRDRSRPYDVVNYGGKDLVEFPIYARRLGPFRQFRVIGGTFLKLLPVRAIIGLLREAAAKGFLPLIYLHPYEFLHEREFWVRPTDLADVAFAHRAYYQVRQHQWLSFGNQGLVSKLGTILREFDHVGPMCEQLPGSARSGNQVGGGFAT